MHEKIVIYGAGKEGRKTAAFFNSMGMTQCIVCFCDKNYENIKNVGGTMVKSPDDIPENVSVIVSISEQNGGREVLDKLKENGIKCYFGVVSWLNSVVKDPTERGRYIVAWYHIDTPFYEDYDNDEGLRVFWNEDSPFYRMFKKLDLSNVIELACGQGRHVRMYLDKADRVTLVDILSNNLDICKQRYVYSDKINYYCNNGYNLEQLEDNKYSALFTYDSMVHFEMLDVYSYLKDIYRVIRPGAYALLHHSNNDRSYTEDFLSGYENRNFMNKDIFAYFAHRCGYKIVQQEVIGWGRGASYKEDLDCITLLQK